MMSSTKDFQQNSDFLISLAVGSGSGFLSDLRVLTKLERALTPCQKSRLRAVVDLVNEALHNLEATEELK